MYLMSAGLTPSCSSVEASVLGRRQWVMRGSGGRWPSGMAAIASASPGSPSATLPATARSHGTPRPRRVPPHRPAAPPEAARRPAAHRLAGARARTLGHLAADGAHGDHAAAGTADGAGSSQLELA